MVGLGGNGFPPATNGGDCAKALEFNHSGVGQTTPRKLKACLGSNSDFLPASPDPDIGPSGFWVSW